MKPQKMNETTLLTGEARVSFPHLLKPWSGAAGQDAKYSVSLLIDANDPTMTILKEMAKAAAVARWGSRLPAGLRMPWMDGNEKAEKHPENAGKLIVKASSKKAPVVIARNKTAITAEAEVYGGIYGRAQISIYAYDQAGNRGVACGLLLFQKTRDGEPFGGAVADTSALDELEPLATEDPFEFPPAD